MQEGERSYIYLKPEYAYGEEGKPPKIPKNANMIFDVEVTKVVPYVSDEELVAAATKWKEDGNKMFKNKELKGAIAAYKYAVDALDKREVQEDTPEIKKLKVSCY